MMPSLELARHPPLPDSGKYTGVGVSKKIGRGSSVGVAIGDGVINTAVGVGTTIGGVGDDVSHRFNKMPISNKTATAATRPQRINCFTADYA